MNSKNSETIEPHRFRLDLIQSGGFLGSLLSKLAGPLMKVAIPLAKNILAPLGITAAASVIDAGIQKKYTVLGQQL